MIHDGKKSFFELNQHPIEDVQAEQKTSKAIAAEERKISTQDTDHVPSEKNTVEKQSSTAVEAKLDDPLSNNENDLNALDYEADKDDNIDEPETISTTVQRVEIELQKTGEKSSKTDKHGGVDEKSNKKNDDTKKVDHRRRRSRSRDKRSKDRRLGSKERSRDQDRRRQNSRSRNDRRVYNRRKDYSPYRRRDARDRNRSRSPSYDRRKRNRDNR